MHAIGCQLRGDVARDDVLVDIELPTLVPSGRGILVAVRAVSVDPVDTKRRRSAPPEGQAWRMLSRIRGS